MKKLLPILITVLLIECKEKHPENDEFHMTVWTMATVIPMPDGDFWREVTGFDSIQLVIRQGKLEANFCYRNKWEFTKWHTDTIRIHDTIIKRKTIYLDTCVDIHLAPDIITEMIPEGFYAIPPDSLFDYGYKIDSLYKGKGLTPPSDNDKPLNSIKL